VRFTPLPDISSLEANLVITAGNPDPRTFMVRVHGSTVLTLDTQPIALEWPPGTLRNSGDIVDLGSVVTGSAGFLETTVKLRNTGSSTLAGLNASLQGDDAAHFSVSSPPASMLNSGGTTALMVQFTPLPNVSSLEANLVIAAANPGVPAFVVRVHGASVAPVATLALYQGTSLLPTGFTVDFGPVAAVPPTTRIFTIKNIGNIELTVQGISFGTAGTPGDFTAGPPAVTVLAPAASTSFPVTFAPSGTGPRTAKLRISSTDSLNLPHEIDLTGSQATPLEAWRQSHFGSSDNEGTGADLSDPDGDSIPNLLEYAALTNPREANTFAGQLVKNGDTLEYSIIRPSAAGLELSYALEWTESPDGPWINTGAGTMPVVLSDDGSRQQVKFSLSAGGSGKRFLRLRVRRL
jgi:hypothetical protein